MQMDDLSKDRFVMADFVGVTDWEYREAVIAAPVSADLIEQLPSTDILPESRNAGMLYADIPVEIEEVEIVSPFDLTGEWSAPSIRAELQELRAQITLQRTFYSKEREQNFDLIGRVESLREALFEEQAASLGRKLIFALRTALPLSKIDEQLVRRAAPDLPDLDTLNLAFDRTSSSMQDHIDYIVAEPVRQRYRELVDTKFTRELTPIEQSELTQIDYELEQLEAPFYDPIIRSLEVRLTAKQKV